MGTACESLLSNERDRGGDGDGGQTATAIESTASNRRDGIGDGDGGQTATI